MNDLTFFVGAIFQKEDPENKIFSLPPQKSKRARDFDFSCTFAPLLLATYALPLLLLESVGSFRGVSVAPIDSTCV